MRHPPLHRSTAGVLAVGLALTLGPTGPADAATQWGAVKTISSPTTFAEDVVVASNATGHQAVAWAKNDGMDTASLFGLVSLVARGP